MSIKLKDQNNNEIFIAGTNSEDFINDEVLRNDKTWSSNKIVEELYPTFQKEGNPITCYPVENYPLNVKATFSPKRAGSGDPSPENVRPISGWDKVQVTRCGKNLIDVSKIDQSIPGESLGTSISVNFPVSITISANYSAATISENIWRFKIGFLDGSLTYAIDDEINGIHGTYKIFNGTSENPITSITYRGTCITSGEISNVMCNIGSTPTPYEPYQGDTYEIALPETVYGGTVDVVTGEGEKTWQYLELDGTENWYQSSASTLELINCYTLRFPGGGIGDDTSICNSFRNVLRSFGVDEPWIYCDHPSLNNRYFNLPKEQFPDVASWKSYLAAKYAAGTPVTIAYKLATPEPFEITPQPILALSGTNTLYTDGDSLIISGKEDIKYTINQITSNIQNINQIKEINNILLGVE